MPRILRDADAAIAGGLAEFGEAPARGRRARIDEPQPQDIATAMAAMQEAIVAKLAAMNHQQMMSVLDVVQRVSTQSELVAKILTGERAGRDRWRFRVTERDDEGKIVSLSAERE